jgi:hypothetical protein
MDYLPGHGYTLREDEDSQDSCLTEGGDYHRDLQLRNMRHGKTVRLK